MTQYSLEEVGLMSFEQVGAIEDPMDLASTGFISPMLVRYVVRTEQLEARYSGIALPKLLAAIDKAATVIDWSLIVGQKMPGEERDARVDAYLDEIGPHVRHALSPN